MKSNITLGSYRHFWSELAILMMSLYLLTDMLSGFSIIYLGIDIKASLLYKVPLFALILGLIASFNLTRFALLLILILVVFFGPLYQFYQHARLDFFITDFSSAIKILTPISIFFLYNEWYKYTPDLALKSTHTILKYGFIILSLNFVIGSMGFGKSTYNLGDAGEAGSTGLIMAGNELGGAFIIAFGYMLHIFWNKKSVILYFLLALFTIVVGFSVSTKTAILASILLVFFIPIVNERKMLYQFTALKVKIFTPMIIFTLTVVVLIVEVLQTLGLYDRILYAYRQSDVLTMLLSGRNLMVAESLGLVVHSSNLFEQIFGQGIAISLLRTQGAITEVDSVDTYVQYGLFTFLLVVVFYIYTLCRAHKLTVNAINPLAPFVLLASAILLILSQLSGHIWSSGTIGILMGVMLGSLQAKQELQSRENTP